MISDLFADDEFEASGLEDDLPEFEPPEEAYDDEPDADVEDVLGGYVEEQPPADDSDASRTPRPQPAPAPSRGGETRLNRLERGLRTDLAVHGVEDQQLDAAVAAALDESATRFQLVADAVTQRLTEQEIPAGIKQRASRAAAAAVAPPPPELLHETLEEFAEWFLRVYRRNFEGNHRTWCPEWWKHPEAVMRMECVWRAHESLRLNGATGVSDWWRLHVDHHMQVLTDSDGPLKRCSITEGHSERPLEATAWKSPPTGLLGKVLTTPDSEAAAQLRPEIPEP